MSLVITIIIGGALVLLALLGAWRGVQRGALAFGATLLGIVLADLWGARLGEWLVVQFEAESAGATAIMSALLLLFTSLVGGYGGALLLSRAPTLVHWSKRMTGAILGLLNAIVLLGYLLRFAAQSNPNTTELIASSQAGRVLHDGLPSFFLAAVGVAVLFLIGTQIRRMLQSRQAIPPMMPPLNRTTIPGISSSSVGIPPTTVRREGTPSLDKQMMDKQILEKLIEKTKESERRP